MAMVYLANMASESYCDEYGLNGIIFHTPHQAMALWYPAENEPHYIVETVWGPISRYRQMTRLDRALDYISKIIKVTETV